LFLFTARQSPILPLFVDASFQDGHDSAAEPEAQEVNCIETGEDSGEAAALERKYHRLKGTATNASFLC
jgi:hypothetical protein